MSLRTLGRKAARRAELRASQVSFLSSCPGKLCRISKERYMVSILFERDEREREREREREKQKEREKEREVE